MCIRCLTCIRCLIRGNASRWLAKGTSLRAEGRWPGGAEVYGDYLQGMRAWQGAVGRASVTPAAA